jgi:hypothetical protein
VYACVLIGTRGVVTSHGPHLRSRFEANKKQIMLFDSSFLVLSVPVLISRDLACIVLRFYAFPFRFGLLATLKASLTVESET